MDYTDKYIKYKNKYIAFKNQYGEGPKNLKKKKTF